MSIRAGMAVGALFGLCYASLAATSLGAVALCVAGGAIIGGLAAAIPPVRSGITIIHTRTQPYYTNFYDWGVTRIARVRAYRQGPSSSIPSYLPRTTTTTILPPPIIHSQSSIPPSTTTPAPFVASSTTPQGGSRISTTPAVPVGSTVVHTSTYTAPSTSKSSSYLPSRGGSAYIVHSSSPHVASTSASHGGSRISATPSHIPSGSAVHHTRTTFK
ncbi:MAG: hypothetical protein JSS07_00065 [Proteobacteria bacterium]|nr:hypothetical protein [Pseudomonadota bacterium]